MNIIKFVMTYVKDDRDLSEPAKILKILKLFVLFAFAFMLRAVALSILGLPASTGLLIFRAQTRVGAQAVRGVLSRATAVHARPCVAFPRF